MHSFLQLWDDMNKNEMFWPTVSSCYSLGIACTPLCPVTDNVRARPIWLLNFYFVGE
jgi:hypothetical protein